MGRAGRLFLISALIAASAMAASVRGSERPAKLIAYPEKLSKNCRDGRAKLYDECSDQLALFAAASKRAAAEHKVLLISYGAEWCIWCHVFDAYVHGGRDKFNYTAGTPSAPDKRISVRLYERAQSDVTQEASALERFVAENFVLLHVDARFGPNAAAVLKQTGAAEHYDGGLPFIFAVGADGRFAADLDHDRVENRRDTGDWYRGYHRGKLLAELTSMRDAALRGR